MVNKVTDASERYRFANRATPYAPLSFANPNAESDSNSQPASLSERVQVGAQDDGRVQVV
jgi:hypothetical protein